MLVILIDHRSALSAQHLCTVSFCRKKGPESSVEQASEYDSDRFGGPVRTGGYIHVNRIGRPSLTVRQCSRFAETMRNLETPTFNSREGSKQRRARVDARLKALLIT